VKAVRALQDPLGHKVQPVRRGQPASKDLQDRQDLQVRKEVLGSKDLPASKGQPGNKDLWDRQDLQVRKEVLGSKDLPAHKAWQANVASRARPVLRDRQGPRVSQGRQALCVTPKALEILSRAMMAKFLFRPFARTVLPPFKELLGPNAARPE
jgi:hypothetical protein